MLIRMTPESCQPGVDFFIGLIVDKQIVPGRLSSSGQVVMLWNNPRDGGPPPSYFIPKKRAERQFWWDGDGRPCQIFGEQQRPLDVSESLRDILSEKDLLQFESALTSAGFRTVEQVGSASPDELPVQLPGVSRTELVERCGTAAPGALQASVSRCRPPDTSLIGF